MRQALARLTLPVLVAAAFAMMLLGKADALLADRARVGLADVLAPLYASLAGPMSQLARVGEGIGGVFTLEQENARLRAENARLLRWQAAALALDAENARLKAALHWMPDPAASFVTGRVVADAGGLYARAVLLYLSPGHRVQKGQVALDDAGLVGRVTEVGARSARVLLLTDLNSRIPVMLEASRAHALLVGTNGTLPRLMYWPQGSRPEQGERVVTSAEAGAFPAGLPVGVVQYGASQTPYVAPYAHLGRLEMLRVFDYRMGGIPPPEARLVGIGGLPPDLRER